MRFLILFSIFSSLLFSERIELEEFYSANSKSEFYYDAVLSCDEVKKRKSLIKIEIHKLEYSVKDRRMLILPFDILVPIFQALDSVEYQNLEERLENLKSLEKEKCKR